MIVMRQIIIILIGTFIFASAAYSQSKEDEEIFRSAVEKLASDEFGGRKPLTEYEDLTVNYIAEKFKEIGLQPANGDSYFQKVPLLNVLTKPKNDKIVVKGKKGSVALKNTSDLVIWSTRGEEVLNLPKSKFVFVGFGINAPEYGWNDYAEVDVKDKIVIALVNDPGFYDGTLFRGKDMTYYGRWVYKFEEASRQGAAGVLVVHDTAPASYGWDVVQASWGNVNLSLFSETRNKELVALQGWIANDAAQSLFKASGTSFEKSVELAKKKGFKSIPLHLTSNIELLSEVKIAESANIAAVLPGTDLKDEYVIYSAHWDHFGYGAPIDGDSIYNGAIDNATGVAALFVLANKFKQLETRPRRSIVFLSVTAEEAVLLGSEYYVRHPLVPVDKTVVNLNMDCYGPRGRTSDIILRAKGDSETDRYVYDAAAAQGRTVKVAVNQSGSYFRSDHFSFAKVGVPVVLAKGGTDFINPEAEEIKKQKFGTASTYHKPTDEYHPEWDVTGTFDDIYFLYGLGYRIGNESYFPKWYEGSAYKAIREKE